MQPLLFLCHRIPYPPNKGDKIRSYNILKYLSKSYQVHLGAFVDDPDEFSFKTVSEMRISDNKKKFLLEGDFAGVRIPEKADKKALRDYIKNFPDSLHL